MTTADQQRFLVMARDYDQMAPLLVPMYGWLQEEMLQLLRIEDMGAGCLVDLGGGSGIFLEKALERNLALHGVWVDFSPAFMEVAQGRLARFADRVSYVLSPIEEDWESKINMPVQAITSMSAIHHLLREEKRALYQRCYDLLAPGGWFLNCDEMKSVSEEAYRASLHFWVRHVDDASAPVQPEQLGAFNDWRNHFKLWKARNVVNINKPKQKGDDLHEPFLDQVLWLQEIGFTGVDVFVKYHLWSMIGGQKSGRS